MADVPLQLNQRHLDFLQKEFCQNVPPALALNGLHLGLEGCHHVEFVPGFIAVSLREGGCVCVYSSSRMTTFKFLLQKP